MSAKDKLKRLEAVEAAPAAAADPLDWLADRANQGDPDEIITIKFSAPRRFIHTLAKWASLTRYTRNGLMRKLLENSVEELEARVKAGKGLSGL